MGPFSVLKSECAIFRMHICDTFRSLWRECLRGPEVFLMELESSGKASVLHFTQHGAHRIGLRKLWEAEEINKGG